MVKIFKGYWTVNDVRNNPGEIFVYGDNDLRVGKGGQAIIRDLPNTIGIRTKKQPNNNPSSFYNDSELSSNKEKILSDILKIKELLSSDKTIVLSNGCYGSGLSLLDKKAPITFDYLCQVMKTYLNYDNTSGKFC